MLVNIFFFCSCILIKTTKGLDVINLQDSTALFFQAFVGLCCVIHRSWKCPLSHSTILEALLCLWAHSTLPCFQILYPKCQRHQKLSVEISPHKYIWVRGLSCIFVSKLIGIPRKTWWLESLWLWASASAFAAHNCATLCTHPVGSAPM